MTFVPSLTHLHPQSAVAWILWDSLVVVEDISTSIDQIVSTSLNTHINSAAVVTALPSTEALASNTP